ncbi:MAG: formate dehydrogenase accessory protein FdhE [Anaerolineae bacterium]|nr:formate dehydrogenase accessory protein FdhE [Anaerolineae bacterium]
MAQTCVGLCDRLKSISMRNGLRYLTGQKRCSLCAHYFHTEDTRCPCCKTRLRSKARSRNKHKNL